MGFSQYTLKNVFKKLTDIIIGYPIICVFLLGIFLYLIHYLVISTANVPIMDYWRMIDHWGEKTMSDNLKFRDIWEDDSSTGNRNPLMAFLLFINMRFFNYNTQIEIFAGTFFILCTTICLIYTFLKENNDKQEQKLKVQFLCLPFILAVFSLNQWEILTLEFSLSFMIRIFSYTGIFILLNHYLLDAKKDKYRIITISVLLIIIICLMSQLFFIALIGSIGIVVFVHICMHYREEKFLYLSNYIYLYTGIIVGTVIYMMNLGFVSTVEININIGEFIIGFIKGTLLMLGSSLCNTLSVYPIFNISDYAWMYILGSVAGLLYIFAIFLYFYKKMYKKTYMPLFLILYCFINIVAIYYARAFRFDLFYMTSSRYTCETTMGLIGILWIFASEILNTSKIPNFYKIIKLLAISLGIIFISGNLVYAMFKEKEIGVYRGMYFAAAGNIMREVDNVPDNELNVFQADNVMLARRGIDFLKKYNLNVFHNDKNVQVKDKGNIELTGFYDNDPWINGNASIIADDKEATYFSLTGYYPEYMPANLLTVTINNNESITKDLIPGESYSLELNFENTLDRVYISLKTERTVIPKNEGWNNDERVLGAFIVSWSLR
jgi:hypothetical protein